MRTNTRISVIFSVFTFFVVLFFIVSINIFSYINWQKWEQKETINKSVEHIKEDKQFLEEQFESLEFELFMLIFITIFSYFLSKYLFSRLIFKYIFALSEKLKKFDFNDIKKIDFKKWGSEINIITNSINNFLDIIIKNRESLKNFNSQVAHEFKTPLMVISSELEYLKLSQQNALDFWNKENTLNIWNSYQKIENQIEKLNNLLSNFLLLTKIDNSKKIKKQNINLFDLTENILKNLENIYKDKTIKIKNNIWKNTEIFTQKDLFEVALKNILDNAFKYNNNWWKIEINFKPHPSPPLAGEGITGILKISDTWIWIKKQNLDKIWNNFYRENEFSKWYWVWLNLVKNICDKLEINISVKSEEGKWSEFIIKI